MWSTRTQSAQNIFRLFKMTAVAPLRYRTLLEQDADTGEFTEKQVFWPETTWVPESVPGVWIQGDSTVLSSDGVITFLDCHVVPGAEYVYPFGGWSEETVGALTTEPLHLQWILAGGESVLDEQAMQAMRVRAPKGAERVLLSNYN